MTSLTRSFCWHSGCEIAATIWSVASGDLDLEEICIWIWHDLHRRNLLLHSVSLPGFECGQFVTVFWTDICKRTLAEGLAGDIICDIIYLVSFFFFSLSYQNLNFLSGKPIFVCSNLGLAFETSFGN
jgi:hypothetical protein